MALANFALIIIFANFFGWIDSVKAAAICLILLALDLTLIYILN